MWTKFKAGDNPLDAPMAGYEPKRALFIARTAYANGLHPCKYVFGGDFANCYVSYGGQEHESGEFECYTGNVKWVKVQGHNIPDNAIEGGYESDGRKLYIGRAMYQDMLITGKVGRHLSRGICIPYGGKEIELDEYEILVSSN